MRDTQHRLFQSAAASWPARERISDALRRAEDYESPGLPVLRGDTALYRSRLPGESNFCLRRAVIDRVSGWFVSPRVLLDPGQFHPGGTAVLNAFWVSPDGARVVTEVALDGKEVGELLVIDTTTANQQPVPRLRVRYSSVAWLPDSSGFWCTARLDSDDDDRYFCQPFVDGVIVHDTPAGPAAAQSQSVASVSMGRHVLSLRTERGASVLTLSGSSPTEITLGLDSLMHVERFSANTADTLQEAWVVASDPSTPPRLYRHDLETRQTQVYSGRIRDDGPDLVHQRVVATMSDGVEVDLLVSARRVDLDRHGLPLEPRALILTCYGGFGVSCMPAYEASLPAWADLGGVYVTAQIRGGGEKGPAWHAAGRGGNKLRAVADLVECAEFLQATGWCTAASLCLMGASHGGLIVLAAALRRPDLCAAVGATAPLLDMTQFHQEGFGAQWLGEFGDPNDPADRSLLVNYSPQHLLDALPHYCPLPAVLCAVFETDERVPPMRAIKFVDTLQQRSGRAWLRSEPKAGHGPKPLDQVRRFSADLLSFAAAHTHETTP
ncbi:prolyl oligopeptidase family serine peptidase [Cryobacterium sp. PH31-O1]|uniref:prolyl oligopeptidase family serine peptidase n=1 Tax=Cryobacterium sp. PH31-O1 TaxID=3046306 RepID=UPI0024B9B20F|nr:prolyl oligopeptidase family serine peptidase [Cryobacterium sp. PH31-O1]MDJ0338722.1 prolyl oligopeptidase family serine peptidase [Cryobacterium sp. PH31-O1]